MQQIIIPITPVAKPRMVRGDRYKDRLPVMRYRAYKSEFVYHPKKVSQVKRMIKFPFKVRFILPMFKSWPVKKKKQLRGTLHKQTPDIDNLLKGFLDAILKEDKHIASVWAEKRWGDRGKIIVSPL